MKAVLLGLVVFAIAIMGSRWVTENPRKPQYAIGEQWQVAKTNSQLTDDDVLNNAVYLLNHAQGDMKDLGRARSMIESLLMKDPYPADVSYQMARFFIIFAAQHTDQETKMALYENAEGYLEQALRIDPEYSQAFVLRGHLYYKMGRFNHGLEALDKAKEMGTKSPWFYINKAAIYKEQNRYKAAFKLYKKAATSSHGTRRERVAGFNGMREYYERVGNVKRTGIYHKKAVELIFDDAWLNTEYAMFLTCKTNDVDEAIKYSKRAVMTRKEGWTLHWYLTSNYLKWARSVNNGNPTEGLEAYNNASKYGYDPSIILSDMEYCPAKIEIVEAMSKT